MDRNILLRLQFRKHSRHNITYEFHDLARSAELCVCRSVKRDEILLKEPGFTKIKPLWIKLLSILSSEPKNCASGRSRSPVNRIEPSLGLSHHSDWAITRIKPSLGLSHHRIEPSLRLSHHWIEPAAGELQVNASGLIMQVVKSIV